MLYYRRITPYAPFVPGTYNIKLVTADQNQAVVLDTNLELRGNTDYTVIVVGRAANLELLVLIDDNSLPEAGQAKVRFVNTSPDGPPMDLAVKGGQVLFSNVSFKGGGNYVTVDGDAYDLEVRATGTGITLLELPWQPLPANSVSTILAVGLVSDQPELEALSGIDNRLRMRPPPGNGYPPAPGYQPGHCCPPIHYRRPQYQGYLLYPPYGPYPVYYISPKPYYPMQHYKYYRPRW